MDSSLFHVGLEWPNSVTILLLVILLAVYVVWWELHKWRVYPPGPFSLPLIGSPEMLLNWHRMNDYICELILRYGQTITLDMPLGIRGVMTINPDNVEHMLKGNFDNYIKGERFTTIFHELLGKGIFNVNGQNWKIQRKTASHIFTVSSLREHMFPVFLHHSEKLEQICLQSASSGTVLNMQDMLFRLTLDALGEIAYSKEFGALDQKDGIGFWRSFDVAQVSATNRFFNPMWPIMNLLGIGSEYKLACAMTELNKMGKEVLEEKRSKFYDSTDKFDLLSHFMKLRDPNGNPYDDNMLCDIILNFMVAGRDTTAGLLTWTIYCVATHPQVEEQLVMEIKDNIGSEDITFENIQDLVYMQAVLNETLRLYPSQVNSPLSVPKDQKESVNDDVFPDGTFIPADTQVLYLPYAQGRSKQIWGEDAAEFKPERWLSGSPQPSPFKFPAFQAGPRTCLGKTMAYLEAKTVLCTLMRSMHFELLPNQKLDSVLTITLVLVDGLKVSIHKRRP